MFSVRVNLFTAAAVYCAAAFASGATASTVRDLPSVDEEPLGEFLLADLIRNDVLGGDCIAEDDIDLAFFATGKGMRLPRTCLPEPCSQALTPFKLAELIGRPAQQSEWDRYFSRYADACRKEVVSFDDAVAEEPISSAEFWAQILGARVVQDQLVRNAPIAVASIPLLSEPQIGGGGGGSGGSGGGGGSGGEPDRTPGPFDPPPSGGPETTTTLFGGDPDDDPDGGPDDRPDNGRDPGDPDPVVPTPVPLPLGLWMLLSAVAGLVTLRRAKR